MQFRFFPFSIQLLIFCCGIFYTQTGICQQVSTNNHGEKIVIFDDGSWRFYNPETDAALEKSSGKKVKDKAKKNKKSKAPKPPKNEKIKKAKKDKGASKSKDKPKKGKKGKKNKNKKSKNKKNKVKKKAVDSATERKAQMVAVRRAERAAAEASKTRRILEEATLDRTFLEQELQEAYASLETTDSDIVEIEGRLQSARLREETAKVNYQQADELAEAYEKMIDMSYHKREKALAKLNRTETVDPSAREMATSYQEPQLTKEQQKKATAVKLEREKMNVMLYPPKPTCNLLYNELDEFSGKIRKDLAKELLFSFTNEKMRPYFKDREFIACHAGLTSLGDEYYFLNVDLEIASENAQRDYGFIEKGAVMVIQFIDGSVVRLKNIKTDMGSLNPLQKSVIYKPQYQITKSQMKTMEKGEVDKIRMVWSSGYEDYEVYQLNFFIDQFRCLQEN